MTGNEDADLNENVGSGVETTEQIQEDIPKVMETVRAQPESVLSPSDDAVSEEIVWFLFGSGVLLTLVLLIRRPKRLVDWLLPLGLMGAGIFFLYRRGQVLWRRREARKETALLTILAELDALDPIARVEVLKAVGEKQLGVNKVD